MPAATTTKTAKTADATPVAFPMGFLDRAGDGTSFAPLHALLSAAGALINPATAEGVEAVRALLAGVLKVAQPDAATSGSIASANANAAFTVALANGQGVVAFALSGLTASGAALAVEASNDGGTTFAPINAVGKVLGDGVFASTLTADGSYRVNAGGHTHVRLRVATTGTGSITVAANASSQNPLVALSGPVPTAAYGVGDYQPMPTGTSNGAPLTGVQAVLPGARAVRLLANPGQSFTYTVARSQPSAAPAVQITVSCPLGASNPNSIDEDLAGTAMVYITAGAGAFRYI